ncbi:MAG: hypothetical protein PHY46_01290, partial [Candidatus Omnitrophica bacterium]|nr:hypothetical protein [Candidatus Omnitrophota bacterium]
MPKFSYIARTKEGARQAGTLEAPNQDEAIAVLQRKELVVVSLIQHDLDEILSKEYDKKGILPIGQQSLKFKHRNVKFGDLVIFA